MSDVLVASNEPERLAALHGLGVLYTAAEERYDRITRMAARLLGVPIALVSLVDERNQWFKSSHGLAATETPREVSFCTHAIRQEGTFVVEDATKDPRFAENPLVTGPPDIRSYAGQPVHSVDGLAVGTLCIIATETRRFQEAELETLRDLAKLVEGELQREQLHDSQRKWLVERDELVAKASVDSLTRIWNRGTVMELLKAETTRAARGSSLSVAMIDIDHFKDVNDVHGHPSGDRVLTETAACIRAAVRDFDMLGRYGGEEFLLVLANCSSDEALLVCERIRAKVAALPVVSMAGTAVPVTVSIGVGTYSKQMNGSEALIAIADRALYQAKRNGRNRVEPGLS